ncbi:Glycerol-3-phosphate acyltransferase [bacterium HR36]|nr:Glycerol-3-phosphate acyltransferase [bacterium HR36]
MADISASLVSLGIWLAWMVGAYLLGAIPFGLLLGYVIAGVDIRRHGSGNIGATNLGRVVGWKYFPLALLLDFAKGALPVATWLMYHGAWPITNYSVNLYTSVPALGVPDTAALIGLAALAGHLWPIYLGFRGGKGVATGAGVVSVLMPIPTAIAAMVWGIVAWMTRYVSLSSLAAALTLALAQITYTWPASFSPQHRAATLLALVGAALVFWRHWENIIRLWQGREGKIGQKAPSAPASSETPARSPNSDSQAATPGESP